MVSYQIWWPWSNCQVVSSVNNALISQELGKSKKISSMLSEDWNHLLSNLMNLKQSPSS